MRPGSMNATVVPEAPRKIPRWFYVRRMQAMVFCGVLFVILGLGLGVGLSVGFYLLGGSVSPTVDYDLDRAHASTTAVITEMEYMANTQVNSRHPWRVSFEFVTPDGIAIEAVGYTFDRSLGDKVVGEAIDVEYDALFPQKARPVGGSASLFPTWVFGMLILLTAPHFVFGMLMLIMVAFRARGERELLERGLGAEAEVLHTRRVRYIKFNARNPFDVHYRFTDRGREITGKDRTYHYAWAEKLKPGDRVGVVYDPRVATHNVLWLHGKDAAADAV